MNRYGFCKKYLRNDIQVCIVFYFYIIDDTDTINTEEPNYPTSSFIADIGGAFGLVFGLNVMETWFNTYKSKMTFRSMYKS